MSFGIPEEVSVVHAGFSLTQCFASLLAGVYLMVSTLRLVSLVMVIENVSLKTTPQVKNITIILESPI